MTDDHYYFDPDGEPIDLMTWARLMEQPDRRLVAVDTVGGHTLKTMYLGFVDPLVNARLYGSAVFAPRPQEVEGYDSRQDAINGHRAHLAAMALGFHCNRCRFNDPTPHDFW